MKTLDGTSLIAIALALLVARPVVSAESLPASIPSAETATTSPATVRFVDAALDAGVAAADEIFAALPEGKAETSMQSRHELRTICLAGCETDLQQCQSDRRAGLHTKDCSALLDACTDVCWARYPAPPPDEGFEPGLGYAMVGGLVGLLVMLYLLSEEDTSDDP